MKIVASILLALLLSLISVAQSQDQGTNQSGSQSQATQGQSSSSTNAGQSMSGTVSHDRKKVTDDRSNKSYRVDNPETLQGKEDQHVALVVQVDPDNNVIHIIQVQPPQ